MLQRSTLLNNQPREQLLSLAYSGVEEEQPWANLVDGLVDTLDAHDASLLLFSKRSRTCCYHVSSDRYGHWTQQMLHDVVQVSYLMDFSLPEPATEAEWGRIPEYRRSDVFKSYLAPLDVAHMVMQDVYSSTEYVWRLSACRTSGQRAFSSAEARLLQMLGPHLQQAINIRERLNASGALSARLLEVIDNSSVGCIVVNARRQIIGANEMGQWALDRGLDPGVTKGELYAALQHAIGIGTGQHDGLASRKLVLTLDGEPCPVIVKPAQSRQAPPAVNQPAALVLIEGRRVKSGQAQEKLLRDVHGLTPAEAAICLLMKEGRTLAEAAEVRGVSVNTIKSHMQAAYQKLQFRRRSQLVKFLIEQSHTLG